MEIAIIIGVLIVGGMIVAAVAAAQAKEKARVDYQQALGYLRQNPTDPRAREDTLAKGRIYSNLTRNSQGVTIYDEMAIKNDLDAACAAHAAPISQPLPPAVAPPSPNSSAAARLEKLNELKASGLITDDEFATKRAAILAEL